MIGRYPNEMFGAAVGCPVTGEGVGATVDRGAGVVGCSNAAPGAGVWSAGVDGPMVDPPGIPGASPRSSIFASLAPIMIGSPKFKRLQTGNFLMSPDGPDIRLPAVDGATGRAPYRPPSSMPNGTPIAQALASGAPAFQISCPTGEKLSPPKRVSTVWLAKVVAELRPPSTVPAPTFTAV